MYFIAFPSFVHEYLGLEMSILIQKNRLPVLFSAAALFVYRLGASQSVA